MLIQPILTIPKEYLVDRKLHKWTEEEEAIVKRDYQGNSASIERISNRLSALAGFTITPCAVKGQVSKLGLSKIYRKTWTPEEDEELKKLIHKYPVHQIAKKMKRGLNSITVRAKRLHFSLRVRDGWFTKQEVCEITGVDHRVVQRWIDSRRLKASWHNVTRPKQSGSAMWHIQGKDLRNFIRRYPGELGRNIDLVIIVDLLVGIGSTNGMVISDEAWHEAYRLEKED